MVDFNENNNGETENQSEVHVAGVDTELLRSIIDRVERLEEERKALGADIRDIFAEAKSSGFDIKALKTLIKMRKQKPEERQEQENWLDVYRHALGM